MRVLVIGLGSIGMRHARNLLLMGHGVFGWDTDEQARNRARDAGINVTAGGCNVDACIVASPTPDHFDHLNDAVNSGWHALVEKPLADELHDLSFLLKEAEQKALVVMTGNNLRFNKCVQFAREKLPLIGKPLWAYFMVAQQNTKYKDHVVLNWLAHECDLALYLLGPAKLTSAVGTDQICDMTLLHDSGVRTSIHGDYLSVPFRRGFTIHGTDGFINCDIELGFIAVFNRENESIATCFGNDWPDQSYIDEMVEFIDACKGRKPAMGATGRDGLATLRILKEAQRRCGDV